VKDRPSVFGDHPRGHAQQRGGRVDLHRHIQVREHILREHILVREHFLVVRKHISRARGPAASFWYARSRFRVEVL
jgi:hypothetical protein